MATMVVKRGDIFYADLSPVIGSEQGGIRPVIIIQNDIGNKYSPTVIVSAITSQINKAKLPTHVEISSVEYGLNRDSVVLLEQIRTLDKKRLKEKIGHIMTPVDCGHFGIDLIIPGINKAHGIQLLMERWNIADEDVMAFGDSGNDQEMLEQATYSFAMANAKESVKAISKYTISSNNDGGVLEAIDWLINKEKMFQD